MNNTAWLVTNHYLHTDKFSEIADFIVKSAHRHGIEITHYTNAELLALISGNRLVKPLPLPDFVLFQDKDYCLARVLEQMGLRLYNSAEAMRICDDKALTHIELAKNKIPCPETICVPFTFENIGYNRNDFLGIAAERLSLPFVIKESKGSFGEQVYLAGSVEQADEILRNINGKPAVLQKFIKSAEGSDIRINVVGGKACASMKRTNKTDFRANITIGGSAQSYTPTDEEEALAVKACRDLGVDFGGVDLLISDNGPLVCEVNSNAHFKSIFDCTGVNIADKIFEYILDQGN